MTAAEPADAPRRLAKLEPGEVHVWYVRVGEDDSFEADAALSIDERERERRLVFEKDRRLYRASHHMVRSVLSRYAEVSPGDWQFASEDGGKPRILAPESAAGLLFNLSHTRGLAAVAVTLEGEVGVDVEQITPPVSKLAAVCFTAVERSWLGDEVEPGRFFELWTLKEAYLKARGLGLALPLQGFSVRVAGADAASISFGAEPGTPAIEDDPEEWQFHRSRVTPEHVLAVALRRPRSRPMRVTLREWRP